MARKKQPAAVEGSAAPAFDYLEPGAAPPLGANFIQTSADIMCELTDAERLEYGDTLTQLEVRLKAQRKRKKDKQDEMRKELNETSDELNKVVEIMDSGRQIKEGLVVLREFDLQRKEVRSYDPATKACLERRAMTPEEIQNPPLV